MWNKHNKDRMELDDDWAIKASSNEGGIKLDEESEELIKNKWTMHKRSQTYSVEPAQNATLPLKNRISHTDLTNTTQTWTDESPEEEEMKQKMPTPAISDEWRTERRKSLPMEVAP